MRRARALRILVDDLDRRVGISAGVWRLIYGAALAGAGMLLTNGGAPMAASALIGGAIDIVFGLAIWLAGREMARDAAAA